MRLSKFLFLVILITCLSLLYVFQQSEIFRLAYLGQKRNSNCQVLLDKNTILRYTIKTKGSLAQIGDRISKNTEYEMPETYRLVKLALPKEGFKLAEGPGIKESVFSRLFGLKRQAEAKTINSQ